VQNSAMSAGDHHEGGSRMRITLATDPSNGMLVRHALAGFAESVGVDPIKLNDLTTALSEAFTNASVHAYPDAPGPVCVEFAAAPAYTLLTVRDWGGGVAPGSLDGGRFPMDVDSTLCGLGVPTIRALASASSWESPAGGGTVVTMRFDASGEPDLGGDWPAVEMEPAPPVEPDSIALSLFPASLACGALPRLARVCGARSGFSVDRDALMQRVIAMIVDVPPVTPQEVNSTVRFARDELTLAVWPFDLTASADLSERTRGFAPKVSVRGEESDECPGRLLARF